MVDNIFANARAVAAETGLLGADRLNRMADCDSPEEAFKILSEVNFGDGANADVSDYERSIEAEEKKLAALSGRFRPTHGSRAFFWLKTIIITRKQSCGRSISKRISPIC